MAKKVDKSLKDIVKERMNLLGINVQTLHQQTGIPASRMYKWFEEGSISNPKTEDAEILRDWLNSKHGLEEVPRQMEPTYLEQRRWGKIVGDDYFVPFVPVKARAGYSKSYDQVDYIKEELETYQMPPGIPWRGAEWRWFEVGGESMEPVLSEKDILLCSLVPHADWFDLEEFKIYVIVWNNDVSVKRIAINKGDFILISENEDAAKQIRVRAEEVKEIWKLRRQLNAKFPPTKKFKITV